MISEKHKELIEKLIAKTANKQAIWSKTSREDEYKISLEKGAITTDNWQDRGRDYVDFTIINDRGDTISSLAVARDEDEYSYNLISKLHVEAKESYYKVDETIEDIFNELDSDKQIGKRGEYDDLPF